MYCHASIFNLIPSASTSNVVFGNSRLQRDFRIKKKKRNEKWTKKAVGPQVHVIVVSEN